MQACLPGIDCPIPEGTGFWIPDYEQYAYGFLGHGNTAGFDFPNNFTDYGDISIQEALALCQWLNHGACLGQYSGVYLASQVPARPNRQLRGEECSRDWRWRVFPAYSDIFDADEKRALGLVGWEGHHGVPSSWMRNVFGGDYAAGEAPVVLTPGADHRNASDLWGEIGRDLDPSWALNTISWFTMRWIAEQMFEESNTPQGCRTTYWDRFRDYATHLLCKKALELGFGVVANVAGLPPIMLEMWQWTGADAAICATLR
jgi:hypothetical protein